MLCAWLLEFRFVWELWGYAATRDRCILCPCVCLAFARRLSFVCLARVLRLPCYRPALVLRFACFCVVFNLSYWNRGVYMYIYIYIDMYV